MNTLKNILREDHDEALRQDIRLLGRLLDAVQAPARVARRAMQEVIIGSRPASRKKTTAIENLRAIPRVFSWAQCRLLLLAFSRTASPLPDRSAAACCWYRVLEYR
jgi:phosphoenolpyruvate carboxylase